MGNHYYKKTKHKQDKARIRATNPSDTYSGFDLMTDISCAVRDSIKESYANLERKIYKGKPAPIAVFLYGSGGRYEMTNYSDIDVHVVSGINDVQTCHFRERLHREMASYGFGKIDDPNWGNMTSLENYAARSITEANQIFDAKFVVGDPRLDAALKKIISRHDVPERKVRNMLFQKFYLEHYYNNRSKPDIPNVKYCSGGYRDLLTFDWFNNWIPSANGPSLVSRERRPQIQVAIEDISSRGIITPEEESKMFESTEFMILLRNEILHTNVGTSDQGITHLDIPTMERTWNSSHEYFASLGASTSEQLLPLFYKHAARIKETKDKIMNYVVSTEAVNKGEEWGQDYRDSISSEISNTRREEIIKKNDIITRLSSIWGMHYHADKNVFNSVCQQMVDTTRWELLASMACSPKSSPELLSDIVRISRSNEGLGYILRIVGRNPSASREILEEIADDSSLDKRYRIVAKLNLEKGLNIATTRAS